MDGTVSNDVMRRRLPPWMLGTASVEKRRVVDSGNGNDNRDVDDDCGCRGEGQKVKNRGGRRRKLEVAEAVQEQRNDFSDGLELEQRCEDSSSSALVAKSRDGKRKKRKPHLDIEKAPKTKRKNLQNRANRNFQSSEDGVKVTGCCSEDGDDEDFLTVEDMMIFAKECVQGNDNFIKNAELMKEDEFVDTIVRTENSIDVPENKPKSKIEEIISFLPSSGVTMKNVSPTMSMSGDRHHTQDMLDLLLGPSLKKAQEKGQNIDLTDEMNIINFGMKRQEKQDMGASVVKEHPTPIVTEKKKTSLRDQVAMFLD